MHSIDISLPQNDESVLIQASQQGDGNAFTILMGKHRHYISSIIQAHHRDLDVDELTQLVYIKVWRNIWRFRQDAAFKTWIYSITFRLCISTMRTTAWKRRQHEILLEHDDGTTAQPFIDTLTACRIQEGREKLKYIMGTIAKLSPPLEKALRLYLLEDLTCTQIAERLHIPYGTVMSRLSNAREQLRKKLTDLHEYQ